MGPPRLRMEENARVPPRGVLGRSAPVTYSTAEAWLGRPVVAHPSVDEAVLRYLAAFGPATPADATAWSRLTGMREVFERLRPRLRVFRDEQARELFDVPDAPFPDADTPAPPRFLPEYDNVLLSHADRSRIVEGRRRVPLPPGNGGVAGTLLVDGFWHATWQIERDRSRRTAVLRVMPFGPLPAEHLDAVLREAQDLVSFAAADAEVQEVEIVDAG